MFVTMSVESNQSLNSATFESDRRVDFAFCTSWNDWIVEDTKREQAWFFRR